MLYTFDDIPKYCFVRYRGDPGHVIDKGDHLKEDIDNRHLLIEMAEGAETERGSIYVNEKLVNLYLAEQRKLFVDWDNKIMPYSSQ